ncbi:phosphotransferase family protein [Spongiimicrobium sp. 2-473A-2-J]|uniref:phosphotransferase family protein n=1 Tax=Eudoraea algarum TaxID=3417568 RepID=UPI003D35C135
MVNGSTQQVRTGEELQEKPLKKFLYEQGLITDENEDLQVIQFTQGYSNLTYLLTLGEQEFVLRRPPFGAIKRGHDMGREYRVQQGLARVFSKVPKMLAYTEDVDLIGAPFYIMERVEGVILSYREAERLKIAEEQYPIIAESWLDTFIALHEVDYVAAGLETLGKPEAYVERQVHNWGKQYVKSATDDVPAAEKVMQWMETHQPREYRHSLIHNDYKYDNVVFKDTSWKEIRAILDWEMATLGDPLMDLGTSLGYWTMANDHDFVKQGIPSPTVFKGNPGRSELVEMYAKKSGKPVDHMVFYYAYGLFKIAVIAQQIYYRFKHGYTADPRFAQLNKAAELCCNLALRAIQTNKID